MTLAQEYAIIKVRRLLKDNPKLDIAKFIGRVMHDQKYREAVAIDLSETIHEAAAMVQASPRQFIRRNTATAGNKAGKSTTKKGYTNGKQTDKNEQEQQTTK